MSQTLKKLPEVLTVILLASEFAPDMEGAIEMPDRTVPIMDQGSGTRGVLPTVLSLCAVSILFFVLGYGAAYRRDTI
jgi:hypothetical protein